MQLSQGGDDSGSRANIKKIATTTTTTWQ